MSEEGWEENEIEKEERGKRHTTVRMREVGSTPEGVPPPLWLGVVCCATPSPTFVSAESVSLSLSPQSSGRVVSSVAVLSFLSSLRASE